MDAKVVNKTLQDTRIEEEWLDGKVPDELGVSAYRERLMVSSL